MSSLLRDAIIDAKALREAALKNAETTVIDKYSEEVRQTLNQLLEQDELGAPELDLGAPEGAPELDLGADPAVAPEMGLEDEAGPVEEIAEDIPLAATDDLSENEGENLDHLATSGKEVNVEINLDALQETIQHMQNETELDINEQTLRELLADKEEVIEEDDGDASSEPDESKGYAGEAAGAEEEGEAEEFSAKMSPNLEEEVDISDDMINAIVEKLTVDMGASLSGWAGRSSYDMKWEIEQELAHRRSTDVEEELKTLKKTQEELVFENNQLTESLEQHKQVVQELQGATREVNLSNARLLYTNRVLRNTSLNERQRSKIADAISKAGSVTEAKTIYHTLESTVGSSPRREPQSLNEALGRQRTSVLRASRQESTSSDPLAERMKRLAGIK